MKKTASLSHFSRWPHLCRAGLHWRRRTGAAATAIVAGRWGGRASGFL